MKLLKDFDVFNTKVFVYWNLHKNCFSVKALTGEQRGRVVAHLDSLEMREVKPRVSQAGRLRVINEKKKNVHAGLVGYILALEAPEIFGNLYYNPYELESFINRNTGEYWNGSDSVNLGSRFNIHAY